MFYHIFKWSEFLKYRNQCGMPLFNKNIHIGNDNVYLKANLSDVFVKDDSKVTYKWVFENNILIETIFFIGADFSFQSESILSDKEKSVFLHFWYQLKNIKFHGNMNNSIIPFVPNKCGWNLLEDIKQFLIDENLLFIEMVQDKLTISGSEYDSYMYVGFAINDDSPKLKLLVLDNGSYYFEVEPLERKEIVILGIKRRGYFDKEIMSIEEEEKVSLVLEEYASKIDSFLQSYLPR